MRCCFCRRRSRSQEGDEEYIANKPDISSQDVADRDDDSDKKAVKYMRDKQSKKEAENNRDRIAQEASERYVSSKMILAENTSDECGSTSMSLEEEVSNRPEERTDLLEDIDSVTSCSNEGQSEAKRNESTSKDCTTDINSPGSESFANEDKSYQCSASGESHRSIANNESKDLSSHDSTKGDVDGDPEKADLLRCGSINLLSEDPSVNDNLEESSINAKDACEVENCGEDAGTYVSSKDDGIRRADRDKNDPEVACSTTETLYKAAAPGDVDVVNERYDKACELLRRSLFQHERSLTSSERTFLLDLIESVSVAPSDEKITEIESASDVLQKSVLFKTSSSTGDSVENSTASAESGDVALTPNYSPTSSRQRIFKKNRVELSVSNISNEVEVSQLHPGSGRSSGSSLLTVNEVLSRKKDASSSVSSRSVNDELHIEKETHESNTDSDSKQRNKKQKVELEESIQVTRFDGWSITHSEHQLEDDDSTSHPYLILGTSANDESSKPHVLSPLVMEAMRGFLPYVVSEENFWMKYSLVRDGASLFTLLQHIRASKWTIIAIETVEGDVFGSFTGVPWRQQHGYFGSGEAFLWRLRKSRWASEVHLTAMTKSWIDCEMEVYPHTGQDSLVQLCNDCITVGGGPWKFGESPYARSQLGVGLRIGPDLLGGESKSSGTFANPPLCRSCEDGSMFEIMNLEVWTMTPCTSVEEAETLELRKMFVEEHKQP